MELLPTSVSWKKFWNKNNYIIFNKNKILFDTFTRVMAFVAWGPRAETRVGVKVHVISLVFGEVVHFNSLHISDRGAKLVRRQQWLV